MSDIDVPEAIENILEHYGTKGMKWGVRKGGVEVGTGSTRRGRATVKTKGGQGNPAHKDAISAYSTKQRLKKSGTHAISNDDLKELAKRLELEAKVNTLTAGEGRSFVQRHLKKNGQKHLGKAFDYGFDEAVKQAGRTKVADRAKKTAKTTAKAAFAGAMVA